jgi:hypothetical protein
MFQVDVILLITMGISKASALSLRQQTRKKEISDGAGARFTFVTLAMAVLRDPKLIATKDLGLSRLYIRYIAIWVVIAGAQATLTNPLQDRREIPRDYYWIFVVVLTNYINFQLPFS